MARTKKQINRDPRTKTKSIRFMHENQTITGPNNKKIKFDPQHKNVNMDTLTPGQIRSPTRKTS